MVRTFIALVVAVGLSAAVGLAQDGKGKAKGTRARGTVKKFDAATGTLTVAVRSRGEAEPKDVDFQVTAATKVTVYGASESDKKELSGPDGFRGVKEGAHVQVVSADGKATEVTVNPPRPPKKGGG
jgi:hypothetical protein